MEVGRDVARQISNGDKRIAGAMIESHLKILKFKIVQPGLPVRFHTNKDKKKTTEEFAQKFLEQIEVE